jgi:hypothetical protein
MDNAIMLGYDELRIVHGKGDGILRTLVRNHLRGYAQVAGMQDEHPGSWRRWCDDCEIEIVVANPIVKQIRTNDQTSFLHY